MKKEALNKSYKGDYLGLGEQLFVKTYRRAEKISELIGNLKEAEKELGINHPELKSFERLSGE